MRGFFQGLSIVRVFEVPTGKRISFVSRMIGLDDSRSGVVHVDKQAEYLAVATDQYDRFPDGTMRRRFVECTPPLTPGISDVWLDNADLDATGDEAGDDPSRVFNAPRSSRLSD